MKRRLVGAAMCATLAGIPVSAAAQPQSAAQQACINALNKSGEKVAKAVVKELARCMKAGSKGKLQQGQTVDECFAADAKRKVAKARQKTERLAANKCTQPPTFGPSDAAAVNAAFAPLRLATKLFGPELQAAVLHDAAGAACQKAGIKAVERVLSATLKAFNLCKKNGLSDETIVSAATLEACFGADPNQKVASAYAKAQDLLLASCASVSPAAAFPGECADAPLASLASCFEPRVACDACRNLNAADGTARNCDPYVDGVAEPRCSDAPASGFSIAREWDEQLLSAIRLDLPRPPVHARNLFHLSVAMYDAWVAYDPVGDPYVVDEDPPPSDDVARDRATAISFAAHRLIRHRFAGSLNAATILPLLDAKMIALGYDPSFTSTAGDSPAAMGNRIAAEVIAYGLADGSNETGDYADPSYAPLNDPLVVKLPGTQMNAPNHWQPLALDFFVSQNGIPLPISVQTYVGSGWGPTAPFALTGAPPYHDPGLPPEITPPLCDGPTDAAFKEAAVEVIRLSSWLDPDDGAVVDISPGAIYNNPLGTNDGTGYPLNPCTGEPYAANLVKRADFGRVIAEYWADGPQSETPPGHWNVIANAVSDDALLEKRIGGVGPLVDDLEWDVKLYLALNGSVHDAAITAWSIKRSYDYVRPISMIRYMGGLGQSSDPMADAYDPCGLPLEPGLIEIVTTATTAPGERHEHLAGDEGKIAIFAWPGEPSDPANDYSGARWILAESWVPYQKKTFVTPPFAAYTSGHSTFSRAAAEVMAAFTGSDYFPGCLGEVVMPANGFLTFEEGPTEDVRLQWARYYDAADEAARSRLWGGIHVEADDLNGRVTGSEVGIEAWARAQEYFAGTALP